MGGFNYTQPELDMLSDLAQEYPFLIAYRRYQRWASANKYPSRCRAGIYNKLSQMNISIIDTTEWAGVSSIARSLGLSTSAASILIADSAVETRLCGNKKVCSTAKFYQWFRDSGAWEMSCRNAIRNGTIIDAVTWAALLDLPTNEIERHIASVDRSLLVIRSPGTATWMTINNFARANALPKSHCRSAVLTHKRKVLGVDFEYRGTVDS